MARIPRGVVLAQAASVSRCLIHVIFKLLLFWGDGTTRTAMLQILEQILTDGVCKIVGFPSRTTMRCTAF